MPASLTSPLPAQRLNDEKLFYVDNIRIVLTILVILHHAYITYGAPGGWYYKEPTTNIAALIPLTLFVSINQSFFMGFFFLLAGFFSYSSYHRKGTQKFITDRVTRLGIPLIFYSFIFSPFLSFLVYRFGKEQPISYYQYLATFDDWIDFGVLWFVAALLLFTIVYVMCGKLFIKWTKKQLPAPTIKTIMLTALIVGILSFIVRTIFPVGWVLKPLGFQLGYFSQYVSLFIIGLLAAKNQWLKHLTYKTGKQALKIALLLFLFFPVFYVIKTKLNIPIEWYSGGFNVFSLLYAIWEQCIGFAIITAFLAIGKQRWNTSSYLLSYMSRRAFAVYIFHPVVLIALALILRNWIADPALKLLLVAPLAVIGSFVLGAIVLWLPGTKRII
ncbi:acyltransferase family protein [Mucilaginibacter sp. KACC 22063]|uniref:acyltransferase family protein n=1 Tax=Mucilaginibacter sp. KACC 22063 TaxID=3025666 RepID=UPI0023663D4E|nr:acyltransferase [Mucilaginibacter sp. KACC 22063]WDF56066.1 acyltransferase [Mucilaginibacter sp. KACC 22063]